MLWLPGMLKSMENMEGLGLTEGSSLQNIRHLCKCRFDHGVFILLA